MRPNASASVQLSIWLRSELADASMYARRHQMNAADEGVDVAAKEFTVSCCKRWGLQCVSHTRVAAAPWSSGFPCHL